MPDNSRTQADARTRVEQLNRSIRQLLNNQSTQLGESDYARGEELSTLQTRYNQAIQTGGQNLYKAKSPTQSVFDYMADAILGYNNIQGSSSFRMETGDKRRDAWLNKHRLEKLFTTGDTQMATYFATTNSDIAHVYDEIDSVCAYFYQLNEAMDSFRDNICSAEQPGVGLSYDADFPTVTDADTLADYRSQVDEAFKYMQYDKKLRDHIVPKTLKYGTYNLMITPYSEVGAKLAFGEINTISGTTSMGRPIFEAYERKNGTAPHSTNKMEIMEAVTELFASFDENQMKKNRNGGWEVPTQMEQRLRTISENLDQLIVNEDPTPANITGLKAVYESTMDSELQKMVDTAIEFQRKKSKSFTKLGENKETRKSPTITAKEIDQIQGCDLRLVDPRCMVPIKMFDYTFGYYYAENYEFSRMGTTLTDIMSNQLNFTERTLIVDRLVSAVLRNLKYKDLVEGDQTLRTMILNCVLYAERRDSPIRIKFVPAEYVVPFNVNTDENGNGQPILLRSLFYARLYTSLLLFNITAIITKSTDSEFYYLKESDLDAQFSNQVSDLIDQFQNNNIDLMRIADGDLLHGNRAINKRYYLSTGTQDIRPVEMEVVSGQQIDIHNEFLTDLKKMAIGSTGEPSVMVDFMDEVEYATMFGMVNIRFMKRSNNYSYDLDPSVEESIRRILKYNGTSIPDDDLEKMTITLRKHKIINNNITAQELNDTVGICQQMIDVWLGGQETNPPEDQAFIKEFMLREIVMDMTSAVPWDLLPESFSRAIVAANKKKLEQDIRAAKLQDTSADSSGEGGDAY